MPIYTYKCTDCSHEFELRQRMSDAPATDCPICAGNVRRMVNNVGIVFKGSGFYVTDNRNGKGPGSNGSGKSSPSQSKSKEGESGGSSSDSSEAKVESTKKETSTAKAEA